MTFRGELTARLDGWLRACGYLVAQRGEDIEVLAGDGGELPDGEGDDVLTLAAYDAATKRAGE